MVNQDIVNYLKEGKKRGFSLQILKQKLLEGGFEDKEINLAISELNQLEMISKTIQPPPQSIQQKTQIFPSASKPLVVSNQQKPIQSRAAQSSSIPSQVNPQSQSMQQKTQPLPQSQQTSNQPAQFPESSSPYFNQKPILNGESISIWLKISGVIGIAILVFSFIFSFAVFSLNNSIVSLIYIAIIIIFSIAYIFGFLKIGKKLDSKLLKLSSLFMMILLFLALVIFLISTFSENKILQSFSTFAENTNTGFAAFLVISTISILILFIISKVLFSLSLIKLKSQLKLAGLAGIVSLINCLFAIISLVLFFMLIFTSPEVFSSSATPTLRSLGDSLFKISTVGLIFVISATIMATLKFISLILEIVMLFKNSKHL